MDLTRPRVTRWTAELVDREQERRFRRYNLQSQRRTARTVLIVILLAAVAGFTATVWGGPEPVTPARAVVCGVALVLGLVCAVALRREHPRRRMTRFVVGAVVLFSLLVAGAMATGWGMDFRGAILVVGGVVVIYLSVPLNLAGVAALALLFSAVTVPAWLALTPAVDAADVRYTLGAAALVHALGFIEARRAQTERRVLFAQRELLYGLSAVDPLTGLTNRRVFGKDLAHAWRIRQIDAAPLSLLLVDIDHFKQLNDSRGHTAGDRALQVISAMVRAALPARTGHIAARYGGDELVCLLPGLDGDGAAAMAGRILAGVRAAAIPVSDQLDDPRIVTVSIGVAGARAGMSGSQDLVDAADRQLYRAKGAGRNCVRAERFDATVTGIRSAADVPLATELSA